MRATTAFVIFSIAAFLIGCNRTTVQSNELSSEQKASLAKLERGAMRGLGGAAASSRVKSVADALAQDGIHGFEGRFELIVAFVQPRYDNEPENYVDVSTTAIVSRSFETRWMDFLDADGQIVCSADAAPLATWGNMMGKDAPINDWGAGLTFIVTKTGVDTQLSNPKSAYIKTIRTEQFDQIRTVRFRDASNHSSNSVPLLHHKYIPSTQAGRLQLGTH